MSRHLGEKLRYARQERGLSQSELARRLELTQHSYITHLEAGRRTPSLEVLVGVAQLLAVPTNYFLQDDIPISPLLEPMPELAFSTFAAERLGNNIRTLRILHGLTQVEAARQLQLRSQGYLSSLEVGKKEPSPDLLLAIANLFDLSTDQLLFEDYTQ